MTTAATRADAEKVLEKIKAHYGVDGEYGPQIIVDWDWTATPNVSIVWEGGPYDWSVEMDFGLSHDDGIWTEAITSWSTAVWKN